MMRVLLVDDEPLALDYLRALVAEDARVQIAGVCRNGREAIALLNDLTVDVMFLDIQMPGLSGLDVVKRLQSDVMPLVIFATAHDEFALQAFDVNAVDYLLKPIDKEGVARALDRAEQRLLSRTGEQNAKARYVSAFIDMRAAGLIGANQKDGLSSGKCYEPEPRLAVKDGSETRFVPFEAIDWVDAAGDYMCVHSAGETHIMRSTMAQLLEQLPGYFVRIHRSTLLNSRRVVAIENLAKGNLMVTLSDDVKLKVSRNYREALLALIGQ